MLIRTEIDGRPASVQYLTLEREPTSEEDAELIYISFDDGDTMWAYPVDDDEPDDEEDEPEDGELVEEEPLENYEEDIPEEEPEEEIPEDLAAQSETTTDSVSRRGQPKIKIHVHQK